MSLTTTLLLALLVTVDGAGKSPVIEMRVLTHQEDGTAPYLNSKYAEKINITFTPAVQVSICQIVDNIANCRHRNITTTHNIQQDLELPTNISGLDLSFNQIQNIPDAAFSSFAQLRVLNLGHNLIRQLSNASFLNLSQLQTLDLSHNKIRFANEPYAVFVPLENLISLNLSRNNDLNFQPLGRALVKIKNNTQIKELRISNINNPYSRGICIRKEFALSLPQNLTILDASSNSIEILESGALSSLPKTLEYIFINDNRFVFGSYLRELDQLESLKTLSVAEWNTYPLPKYYPSDENPAEIMCHDQDNLTLSADTLIQALPPKLEELHLKNAGWANYLTEFHFNPNNSLRHINLDFNYFPRLQGPITGLHKLETISFIACDIEIIDSSFFDNLSSLKHLNLFTNNFGKSLIHQRTSPFMSLVNLESLNLSYTDLSYLQPSIFANLTNLKTLRLDRNPISNFSTSISSLQQLKYINFSKTLLHSLDPGTRATLDRIQQISNLTIDFAVDIIHCLCSNIGFIEWMTQTLVLPKKAEYKCMYDNEFQQQVGHLEEVYKTLLKACISNYTLLLVIIASMCLLLAAIVAAFVYRYRWKIWFLYYSAMKHYNSESSSGDRIEYEFDVFVSYAHEDHDFVVNTLHSQLTSRGLRVLIHGLHFIAGQYISSNIVQAVQSSRRTLVVLTRNLVQSKWSRFEVEMAQIEHVNTGRPVLLFLIKEHIPKLNPSFLFHLQNNTYIQYPDLDTDQGDDTQTLFWSRLVSALKA